MKFYSVEFCFDRKESSGRLWSHSFRNLVWYRSYLSVAIYSKCLSAALTEAWKEMGSSYADYETRRRDPNTNDVVLLVIDMQNYFKDVAGPILAAVRHTIESCRAQNIPVIYTRHSHKSPADYGMLGEWWNDVIHEGTPEADLMPEVDRRATDKVVHKHTYSGFYDTDLEKHLRTEGKTEVIITGVMTNLCCETTARDAFIRGFRVFFSTDATATSNEDLHASTLKNMAYGFAYLVNCQRLDDAFSLNPPA